MSRCTETYNEFSDEQCVFDEHSDDVHRTEEGAVWSKEAAPEIEDVLQPGTVEE